MTLPMKPRISKLSTTCALVCGLAALVITGPASSDSCDLSNVTWGGNNSGDCQVGTSGNDFVSSPLQVNQEIFFGYSDWVYLAKYEAEEGTREGPQGSLLTLDPEMGENPSGTWSFAGTLNYEDVMIVLKAGNPNSGGGFEGYLWGGGIPTPTLGTWDSHSAFDKDLSHLTIYKRGSVVPIPAAAWLFGSALLGMAGMGYRRSRRP